MEEVKCCNNCKHNGDRRWGSPCFWCIYEDQGKEEKFPEWEAAELTN